MTEIDLIKKVAKAYNNLDYDEIKDIVSVGIVYESQNVLSSLKGKHEVADYMISKFETIKNSGNEVFAELGYIGRTKKEHVRIISAKEGRPCIILSQGKVDNKVALILIESSNDMIDRIDICTVAPHWSQAEGTNEFPQ